MSKLEVTNVTKIFGKRSSRALSLLKQGNNRDEILQKTRSLVAVNNVSFTAKEGEVVVIIGLSGSGKSTLLRCLNRIIEPTAGNIKVDGIEVGKLSNHELRTFRQERFGMVFQHFALFPHYSVWKNVAYGLELMGVPEKERREIAYKTLEKVSLDAWAEYMPHNLSGGMQQRVGLARALALDPEILLMDEAFSALDPLTRREMQAELIHLQQDMNKTIVFITHDLDEALSLGDRIILLRDGAIVQEGTAEEILSAPEDDYVTGFVSQVDRGKVLTAKAIMAPPAAVAVAGVDGPITLLRKMSYNNINSILVVDDRYRLLGIVTEENAIKHRKAGTRDILDWLKEDMITANPDDLLTDLVSPMASAQYPIPVLDVDRRLRGIIVRGTLLDALSSDAYNPVEKEKIAEVTNVK